MKKTLRICALLLTLALLLSAFVGCGAVREPLAYLKNCIKETLEDSFGGLLADYLFEALEGGSVALDFGGTDLLTGAPDRAALKLTFDADDARVAADGALTLGGKTFDAAAYMDEDVLVMTSKAFFGSTTLGVDFGTLERDLRTSIFASNSGTAYAAPNVSDATAWRVLGARDSVFSFLSGQAARRDLAKKALDVFVECLAENASVGREREKGRVLITLDVDNDALSRALRDTWEELVDDKDFCRELLEMAQTMDRLRGVTEENAVVNQYEAETRHFLENEQYINSICTGIDKSVPFLIELDARIKSAGDSLEELGLRYTVASVETVCARLVLADIREESSLTLNVLGNTLRFTHRVTKDTLRTNEAEISLQASIVGMPAISVTGNMTVNMRERSFALSLLVNEREVLLVGGFDADRRQMRLSLDGVRVDGTEHTLSLALTITKRERMSKVPDYVGLVSISAARYAPIDERMDAALADLLAAWEQMKTDLGIE